MGRKYTKELLEPLVADATSVADVLRSLGLRLNGGAHAHISRTIKALGLDTSHFVMTPRSPGGGGRTADDLLVRRPTGSARTKRSTLLRAMIDAGFTYACAECGNAGVWQDAPLTLQIDHIDGDFLNNQRQNLRLLCPNCHRLTPNFAGRSRGRYTRPDNVSEARPA